MVAKEDDVANPMQMWNGAVESISTILSKKQILVNEDGRAHPI